VRSSLRAPPAPAPVLLAALALLAVLLAAPAASHAGEARNLVAEGDALAARGDPAAARTKYEEAIAVDHDLLEAYDAAAPLWLAADDFATAIRYLERVTLRHPAHAVSWYQLAYAYRRSDRWLAAAAAYEAYVALRPVDPAPWFGLAVSRQRAGLRDEALSAYRRYLELERDLRQTDFVARARAAIVELGGTPPPRAAMLLAKLPALRLIAAALARLESAGR
jgi:tetratricopeptide (TPR) repeat protein